jgi:hypothetical protein
MVAFLADVRIASGQTSEATMYMPEVVSDSPYDFMKMLESRPQEL